MCLHLGRGKDYNDVLVNVTFPAGSTSQVVSITLIDDGILEPTESFAVEITGVHHEREKIVPCVIAGASLKAVGVILNSNGNGYMYLCN